MLAYKTTARIVGVLFIVASATAIIGGSLLIPIGEADYVTATVDAQSQIVTGVLLEFVLVLSVVGIAVMIYPVLKHRNEGLALGYIGSRTLEAVLLLAATLSALFVLSFSTEVVGGSGVSEVGDTLLAVRDWTYLIGSVVMLGVSALILNGLLLGSRVVPPWLSVWGLIGGALILVRGLIEMYGVEFSGAMQAVLAGPIALQEMVLALWLIVKGFSLDSIPPRIRHSDEPAPLSRIEERV